MSEIIHIDANQLADDLANGEANSPAALLARIAILEARLKEAEGEIAKYKREHVSLREQIDRAVDDGIADTEEEKTRRLAAEARAERYKTALNQIIKRTEDCAPLVATDVREIARAALGEKL